MTKETIKPTRYSSPIIPPLQPITAGNVEPRDYKKYYGDNDEYNVKHFWLLPERRFIRSAFNASAMPRNQPANASFSKSLMIERVVNCRIYRSAICKMQARSEVSKNISSCLVVAKGLVSRAFRLAREMRSDVGASKSSPIKKPHSLHFGFGRLVTKVD